ncbi:lipopolysaccharide O-acetyltransferase [Thermoflexales bacterium]|nr:lipopolysaccharide O-acetyltransferase [Thermoflexales bacterium]
MRTWLDRQEERLERRLQLLRGRWHRWRGAHTGRRFGVGQGVRILYPACLQAGDDVTLYDYSYLHCLSERGVCIGNHTSIDRNLWLHCGGTPTDQQHGYFEIGEHSYIGCNAVMGAGGGIRIGQHVLIGQGVHIHAENHNFADAQRHINEQGVTYQEVVIEDDVWIGSRVMILAGVTIGRGAVIGGGAVVTTSIPPYAIAVGVPARVVGQRGSTA